MESKALQSEQTLRLMSVYQQMPSEDRDALDRLLGQLAEAHRAFSEVFDPSALE